MEIFQGSPGGKRRPREEDDAAGREIMARPRGLEPRFSESESDVLPLHHGRTETPRFTYLRIFLQPHVNIVPIG